MSEFGDAFKKARQSGMSTFEYKGKKYGTRLAGESKDAHAKYLAGKKKSSAPKPRKKEETVSLPKKSMPKVAESKPAPAKAVKKSSTAPRSGSAVSRPQRETEAIRDLKDSAMAQRAKKDKVLQGKASRDRELGRYGLGGKKPPVKIAPDFKDRGEQIRAMNEYEQTRKKVKGVSDKYKDTLSRVAKMFGGGGSLKAVPAGAKGLSKLPTAVRNKMGYAKKGSKMPSYGYGGKMKK